VVSKKTIDDDLNRVEESAAKSTYKLGVGFQICEHKGEKSAFKFLPSSNYHEGGGDTQIHQNSLPIQSKVIFQPQEGGKKRNPQAKRGSFYLHVLWP
jgi:hypothetical protein